MAVVQSIQLKNLTRSLSANSHNYYWYSITHLLFHSRLNTMLFCKYFPPAFPFLSSGFTTWFPQTAYCLLLAYMSLLLNTGRSPGQAEGLAGCGHSKIARVRAYYLYCTWLPVLTSLYVWLSRNTEWTVTKYRVTRNTFISNNCYNGKNTLFGCFR